MIRTPLLLKILDQFSKTIPDFLEKSLLTTHTWKLGLFLPCTQLGVCELIIHCLSDLQPAELLTC